MRESRAISSSFTGLPWHTLRVTADGGPRRLLALRRRWPDENRRGPASRAVGGPT